MPDHVSERKDYVSQVAAVACSPSNVGFVVEAPQRTLDRVEQFDNRGGLPTVATDCRPTSNADIAQLTNCDRALDDSGSEALSSAPKNKAG